jgi:hypothetical protein
MSIRRSLGQIGYEAYRKFSSGKSLVSGLPVPAWAELPDEMREAWQHAGDAIASEVAAAQSEKAVDHTQRVVDERGNQLRSQRTCTTSLSDLPMCGDESTP